jgi:hypothetical protein
MLSGRDCLIKSDQSARTADREEEEEEEEEEVELETDEEDVTEATRSGCGYKNAIAK